ncbi:MAG: 30S ribosomal protein S2 [Candidatus Shapirobacteria bacterium]|jgi:small subunit ribosomal protein S2
MAKKIVKTKTVNRTGKKIVKKALVIKEKKEKVLTAEKIKSLNEKTLGTRKEVQGTRKEELEIKAKDEKKILEDKKYNLTVGLKDLLAAGCHLGHKVSKTNPKAKGNLYKAIDGIQVFDLVKTMAGLEAACNFVYNSKRNGKQIVLVGTKRQAKEVVKRVALDAGVAYITNRWLGGTITNWDQIRKTIKRYWDWKEGLEQNKFTNKTKRELLEMSKELVRIEKNIGGLAKLDKLFDVMFVVDAGGEKTAVKEASLTKVKIVGMVDTDTDPAKVDFPIPANDDNVKSVTLIVEEIGKAIKAAGVK